MADTANIVMPLEQEGSKSTVRAWLKKVGDAVKRDEPIVELETDKVAVEVPAPADGVLASIALGEGDEAAPGATLGVLNTSVIPDARGASPAAKTAPLALGSGSSLRSARNDSGKACQTRRKQKNLLTKIQRLSRKNMWKRERRIGRAPGGVRLPA